MASSKCTCLIHSTRRCFVPCSEVNSPTDVGKLSGKDKWHFWPVNMNILNSTGSYNLPIWIFIKFEVDILIHYEHHAWPRYHIYLFTLDHLENWVTHNNMCSPYAVGIALTFCLCIPVLYENLTRAEIVKEAGAGCHMLLLAHRTVKVRIDWLTDCVEIFITYPV